MPAPVPAPPGPALLDALRAHTTLTLAYADADGPQACAVLYAVNGPHVPDAPDDPDALDDPAGGGAGGGGGQAPSLVFVTAATTRHGRALSAAPAVPVAFTAQADGQEWTALTGVQGRGVCRRLPDGPRRALAWQSYTERFPFVAADPRLRSALESTALWELHPTWLRLIDNGRGFGTKVEWPPPPEG